VLGKKDRLIAQCVGELERLLRKIASSRLINRNSFRQQIGSKRQNCTVITLANRVGNPVGFVAPEKQNVIRIRDDGVFSHALYEHTFPRKHDVVCAGSLLGATFASMRPTGDVAERNASAPVKHTRLKGRGHTNSFNPSASFVNLPMYAGTRPDTISGFERQ
jgi:hypothetical protein